MSRSTAKSLGEGKPVLLFDPTLGDSGPIRLGLGGSRIFLEQAVPLVQGDGAFVEEPGHGQGPGVRLHPEDLHLAHRGVRVRGDPGAGWRWRRASPRSIGVEKAELRASMLCSLRTFACRSSIFTSSPVSVSPAPM